MRHLIGRIADRQHRPACHIEPVEIDILHRIVIGDIGFLLARREAEHRPAATIALEHHPRRGRIARVHHVEIRIDAVAAGRAEGQQVPVGAPRALLVAALAIGQQGEAPILEGVKLEVFIPAPILADHDHIAALGGIASADRLGLEGDLGARAHRLGHAVKLVGVGKARADQHRARVGIPTGKARAARFEIGPRAFCHGQRDRRHLFGGERGGQGDRGFGGGCILRMGRQGKTKGQGGGRQQGGSKKVARHGCFRLSVACFDLGREQFLGRRMPHGNCA